MTDRDSEAADGVPERIKTDRAVTFEEHFLAAYLVGMEGCDAVLHNARHFKRKHPDIAAVGFSSTTHRYVGCDVLDWIDTWWPAEMNQAKVLPKLQERVKLFREMIPVMDLLRNGPRGSQPQSCYIFFSFSLPSRRIQMVIPSLEQENEVRVFSVNRVKELARTLADYFASTDVLHDNHFARTVQLLADERRGARGD